MFRFADGMEPQIQEWNDVKVTPIIYTYGIQIKDLSTNIANLGQGKRI